MQRDPGASLLHWRNETTTDRRASITTVVLSIAIHSAVAAVLLAGSGQQFEERIGSSMTPVFYLPPPDRAPSELGAGEQLQYVALAPEGAGGELEAAASGDDARLSPEPEEAERSLAQPGEPPAAGEAPVYTVVEVDEEAVRVATSAAPAYPERLLEEGIEGMVIVQYVVDATGLADSSSLRVVTATRREFADAVRAALPHMRFTPARLGQSAVRQLVEQPFVFRIDRSQQATPDSLELARTPAR